MGGTVWLMDKPTGLNDDFGAVVPIFRIVDGGLCERPLESSTVHDVVYDQPRHRSNLRKITLAGATEVEEIDHAEPDSVHESGSRLARRAC